MIKNLKSKSQGHVEMIISFALFIGALVFIFFFINPLSKTSGKITYVKNIEKEVIDYTNDNIGKLSIITDSTKDCYFFEKEDYRDRNFKIIQNLDNPRIYSVYFSDIFDASDSEIKNPTCEGGVICDCKIIEDFTLSSYYEENIIVYEKLQELKTNYERDYEQLKDNLGINREFLFSVLNINGNKIPELSVEKKTLQGIEKESEFIPIRVIDKNAQIQELMMNIIVW